MRLMPTRLRSGATAVRPPRKRATHPEPDATPKPVAPDTQVSHPDTQPASPADTRGRKATQRADAKAAKARNREDAKAAKATHRAGQRADLRRRASALAARATGRHYERVGFATKGRRTAAYLSLLVVLICVGYMSWTGEYAWATHELLWVAVQALMVPVALDVAAVACTLLGLDQIDKGESGFAFRVLGAVFMGLGAWINWRYAIRSGNATEEVFFPAMSLLAYALVHAVMGAARREAQRRQHGHKSRERVEPLPRFGLLVWVPWIGAPKDALGAVRESVALRMATALAATQVLPEPDATEPPDTQDRDTDEDQGDGDDTHDEEPPVPELTQMGSQANAIRWVLSHVSNEPFQALQYMRSHGYPEIKPQRIHDQIRRDQQAAAGRTDTRDATSPSIDATEPDAQAAGE